MRHRILLAVMTTVMAAALGCGTTEPEAQGSLATTEQKLELGGPVILGGDDLTDHGSYSGGTVRNGWFYIQVALQNLKPKVTRAHDGTVAVLGASSSTAASANAGAAYYYAAPLAGLTPRFYDGVVAIENFLEGLENGTHKPAILVISGTGAANDVDSLEANALSGSALAIANFVNSGGGLLAHGYGSGAYGWLSTLIPGLRESTTAGCDSTTLSLTSAGQAAFPGLTNTHIRAGPCHSSFTRRHGRSAGARQGQPGPQHHHRRRRRAVPWRHLPAARDRHLRRRRPRHVALGDGHGA